MRQAFSILIITILTVAAFEGQKKTIVIQSPDRKLAAYVISFGTKEYGDYESRIEIRKANGRLLHSESYISDDHEHGQGVLKAEWTPDSKFFVFSTVNSGGHQPWHFPTYYYSRSDNKIYEFDHFVGSIINPEFNLKAPDVVIIVVQDPTRNGDTENGLLKSVCLSKLQAIRKGD